MSSVHFSAEKSPFYSHLVMAEENAKSAKLKIWANYEETKPVEVVDDTPERQCNYEKVFCFGNLNFCHIYFYFFCVCLCSLNTSFTYVFVACCDLFRLW